MTSQQNDLAELLSRLSHHHDLVEDLSTVKLCGHKHSPTRGTGCVPFQSRGVLLCVLCGGWQSIRKPVD